LRNSLAQAFGRFSKSCTGARCGSPDHRLSHAPGYCTCCLTNSACGNSAGQRLTRSGPTSTCEQASRNSPYDGRPDNMALPVVYVGFNGFTNT